MDVFTLPVTNQKEKKNVAPKFGSYRCDFETPELDNIIAQNSRTLMTSVASWLANKQCLESSSFVFINIRYVFCCSIADVTHLTSLKLVLS